MPGSPYLDEPPKGLLTWPRVLRFSIPALLVTSSLALAFDVVFETLIGITVLLTMTALIRR